MLSGIFDSKNKKLTKKWTKEHEQIVVLANKVIGEYVKNNHRNAKNYLKQLGNIAADHLVSEDIEFYKLVKDPDRNDPETVHLVEDFQTSFKDVKRTLMEFLAHYTKNETELDSEFFDTFNSIVEILAKRIEYEEDRLYFRMSLS